MRWTTTIAENSGSRKISSLSKEKRLGRHLAEVLDRGVWQLVGDSPNLLILIGVLITDRIERA